MPAYVIWAQIVFQTYLPRAVEGVNVTQQVCDGQVVVFTLEVPNHQLHTPTETRDGYNVTNKTNNNVDVFKRKYIVQWIINNSSIVETFLLWNKLSKNQGACLQNFNYRQVKF